MKALVLALSFLCVVTPAFADESGGQMPTQPPPPHRTAVDDCLGRLKTPKDFDKIQLSGFDDTARQQVGDELAGLKVCEAIVSRSQDPCASLTGIGKIIASPDKRIEGTMIGRCRDSIRFARFYQEALHASPKEKRFPACLEYFRHIPIVNVAPGFDAMCAAISQYIQKREDKFCDPRILPFVKDQQKWDAFCKIVGDIYLHGSAANCSYFPEPGRCAAAAQQVPAFQNGQSYACATTLEGGVCHAYIPLADPSGSRCRLPWTRLSRDYCQGLVASGAFNKAGKDKSETAPSEDK